MIKKHSYNGFTMIEIMIALLISMILLGGTMLLFISNQESSKHQRQMGGLQEGARFAMDLLARDIRMSGYVGCRTSNDSLYSDFFNHIDRGADGSDLSLLNFELGDEGDPQIIVGIDGVEGSAVKSTWLDGEATSKMNILNNSDAITVRYFRPRIDHLPEDISPTISGTDNIPLREISNGVCNTHLQGTYKAISACGAGVDIFGVTNEKSPDDCFLAHDATTQNPSTGLVINESNILGSATETNSYSGARIVLSDVVARRYFIADDTVNNTGPALWMCSPGPNACAPLIEGVENMQILYGVDTTGDNIVDQYVEADNLPNSNAEADEGWSQVLSVKLAILTSTVDEILDTNDGNTYDLLGTVVSPMNADKRKRKIFAFTVAIRNRLVTPL